MTVTTDARAVQLAQVGKQAPLAVTAANYETADVWSGERLEHRRVAGRERLEGLFGGIPYPKGAPFPGMGS